MWFILFYMSLYFFIFLFNKPTMNDMYRYYVLAFAATLFLVHRSPGSTPTARESSGKPSRCSRTSGWRGRATPRTYACSPGCSAWCRAVSQKRSKTKVLMLLVVLLLVISWWWCSGEGRAITIGEPAQASSGQ